MAWNPPQNAHAGKTGSDRISMVGDVSHADLPACGIAGDIRDAAPDQRGGVVEWGTFSGTLRWLPGDVAGASLLAMQVTLDIPDDVAASLGGTSGVLTRTALEALAVEGYRGGALTTKQVRLLLGHASRWETEDFLSKHGVWPGITPAEAAADSRTLNDLLRR